MSPGKRYEWAGLATRFDLDHLSNRSPGHSPYVMFQAVVMAWLLPIDSALIWLAIVVLICGFFVAAPGAVQGIRLTTQANHGPEPGVRRDRTISGGSPRKSVESAHPCENFLRAA